MKRFKEGGLVPVREAFSNASIDAPVKRKPHVCVRAGWWRVSQLPRNVTNMMHIQWRLAHDFAGKLNHETSR